MARSHASSGRRAGEDENSSEKRKKRKRDNGKDGRESHDALDTRPPKRTQPSRERQIVCDDLIGKMDPSLLADHFAKATKKHYSDCSPIELEDLFLPTKAFRDTTSFGQIHTAPNITQYLENFTPKDELMSSPGSPHTIFITSSGIRTADLDRELRIYNSKEVKVAKLIAKHMKLKDNIKYMEKNKVGIAVSTPARLKDLFDNGAMRLGDLKRIVIDGSYQDEKSRSIFEMEELFKPMMALLNIERVKEKYGVEGNRVEIMVF